MLKVSNEFKIKESVEKSVGGDIFLNEIVIEVQNNLLYPLLF